ncbi:hypothetical protein ABZ924_21645 [Streptomyces sp. NPDC046876]|uniref:hypothetical protein n=1 Tax=Streptomyces sp. NPDC046876 TaxID=3155616 RepID=UPI0033F959F0
MAGVLGGRTYPGSRGPRRGWTKVRRRDSTAAVIGAVTGTLTRCPQLLVLGRLDQAGRLRAVGRPVPLRPEVSQQVGEHLAAAGPGRPFEGVQFAASWRTARASSGTRSGFSGSAWT